MTEKPALEIWTIHRQPDDFPDYWVVTVDHTPGGRQGKPKPFGTLEAARASLPPGLYRMGRFADDPPNIYETWF